MNIPTREEIQEAKNVICAMGMCLSFRQQEALKIAERVMSAYLSNEIGEVMGEEEILKVLFGLDITGGKNPHIHAMLTSADCEVIAKALTFRDGEVR
jgi:hypothetical protein